jgi:hypothetical protein
MKSYCPWIRGVVFFLALALMVSAVGAAQNQDQKEITVTPQILGKYVGTYELAPNFKIMVTLEGGQLSAQATGQAKLPLFASSETRFFYKVVQAEIEFFKNDQGVVSHLVLYQNGQEMRAPRISDTVAVRKEIAVPAAVLSRYVGTYELQPGFDLMITLEGNQLISQATGQGKAPLFAASETKFFLKVVDAEIEFVKDNKGAVTHLILHQGPQEIKAAKK